VTIGPEFDSVLAAAQAGANWAVTVLYREMNPLLLRYLGAQGGNAAEDIAADTWLAVARQLPSFTGGEGAFRAWLFTIARRRMIQRWRENGRRRTAPVSPESLADWPGPDDAEASGVKALSAREIAVAIAAALPPDQADVVLLRMVAGLDVAQVADILGKRPGTVRSLQHKALRTLATTFSAESLAR
jgi:RNA polymerase sigma-70 factor (ECF subfamily)